MHHTAESRDSKKRTLGVLVASRWPVALLERAEALVPWPEKVLSATVATPNGSLELHAVHVPNGSANQWVKIETLQGIAKLLSCSSAVPRILCGDFNTPKHELPDGRIVTWAQDLQLDGTIRTQKYRKGRAADEWDEGERAVLLGLSGWDLPDVFRQLHGYEVQGHSPRTGVLISGFPGASAQDLMKWLAPVARRTFRLVTRSEPQNAIGGQPWSMLRLISAEGNPRYAFETRRRKSSSSDAFALAS